MGKPYQSELAALRSTLAWAIACDISLLAGALRNVARRSLVATGSGGSLSAAKLAAGFHQLSGAGFAKSATPLEIVAQHVLPNDAAYLLLSAGGANTDVLGLFRHLAYREQHHLIALTARKNTPLGRLVQGYPTSVCLEHEAPSGRDGFLATNSLATFSVLLARAYITAFGIDNSSLGKLSLLASSAQQWASHVAALKTQAAPLWLRNHLVILFPPEAEAGAIDLESKFTEAALGSVHIADYRHFAHGRHHWLAKHGDDSAVLSFISPRFRELAESTLTCLPKGIPVARVELPSDPFEAGVLSILAAIVLAGCAGAYRGIDPGRPGVPSFGRKIYHLRWRPRQSARYYLKSLEAAAVSRKQWATGQGDELHAVLRPAFRRFCGDLGKQHFKGIVLDYDGTIVPTAQRFDPLSCEIAKPIISLLKMGVIVGIASGRGKSLRAALQKALPRHLWDRVVLGYYNGSQTALLSEDTLPVFGSAQPELLKFQHTLCSMTAWSEKITVESRPSQLSVTAQIGTSLDKLWRQIMECFEQSALHGFKVVCSGHSVDILSPGVSKLAVVERVQALARAKSEEVLRIGDQGGWPGNDYELLAAFPALSVDKVSAKLDSCWNLAPRGHMGPSALLAYLKAMDVTKGVIRLDISCLEKGWR